VFLLVTPLSHWAWFVAYVGASWCAGWWWALGVFLVTVWFAPPHLAAAACPGSWCSRAGRGMMGALGLIAGLWADKFDQLAAFQNFIIMPMTFCRACSIRCTACPPFWQAASHLNPFFYMIDGFRAASSASATCRPG
jgi:ABC-2 type transport system permease protein